MDSPGEERSELLAAFLYDWNCRQFLDRQLRDIEFYAELAEAARGFVLELACGTGRISLQLAALGADIVGLDIDPGMVELARQKARSLDVAAKDRLELHVGDMTSFRLSKRFGLIAIPYNSFQILLDHDSELSCLTSVREHLDPGGRLAMELTPFHDLTPRSDWSLQAVDWLVPGSSVASMHERVTHDPANPVTHFDEKYDIYTFATGDVVSYEQRLSLRTISRADLELLLREAGFSRLEFYGDYDFSPPDVIRTERMLVVARL